jgi:hypothetical protein
MWANLFAGMRPYQEGGHTNPSHIRYMGGAIAWSNDAVILGDKCVEPASGHFDIALDQAMLGRLPGHGNRGASVL